VLVLVGLGVAAAVAGGLIGLTQAYLAERISQGIIFDLREQLFDRLVHQSVGFYTTERAGEVMSRIGNDVNGIENVVADTVFGVARNAIVAATTLGLMFAFDWRLTLVALGLLPLVAIPMRRAGRRVYAARGRTQRKLAELTAYLQEVLGISGALLVKAFVRERAEQARFRGLNDELRHLEIRASMIARRFGTLMTVLESAGPALLILAGGWLVIHEGTSVGTVFVFATVLTVRFGGAVGALGETQVNLLGQRRPALADFSARMEPGQLVALVGPSGGGKTTLTTLIPRFYDPQQGRLTIDGHDVRTLTLESLRRHIGIVFQDTSLFHASVRENLLYARPDASEAQMVLAARAAYMARLHRLAARGLRHDRRRARPPAQRRREAAHGHRPCHPQGPARPAARRGHLKPRHRVRAAHPSRPATPLRRADVDRHRPPPLDHPRRRSHPRPRPRSPRRAGSPRRAARARRALRHPL
jgi:ATP-binding cassette, subfamily B, bacterial